MSSNSALSTQHSAQSGVLISWNTTNACNLKCSHCYRDAGEMAAGELSFEEGRQLLRGIRQAGFRVIVFSGGEPLNVRLDIDPALLPEPNVLEIMQARADAGDDVRLTSGLPFTGAVNDQGLAMIDLGDDGGTPVGILLNRETGGARVHAALELAWRLGTPWRPSESPATQTDLLDPRDRGILRLMAGGVSDAAIARQLGISSRTVERRVRLLLDRLNASTRFQAGVLAARQGRVQVARPHPA